MRRRSLLVLLVTLAVAGAVAAVSGRHGAGRPAAAAAPVHSAYAPAASVQAPANPPAPEHHDVSPPLRTIPPAPPTTPVDRERHEQQIPGPAAGTEPDPVVQTSRGGRTPPALSVSFQGLGDGFSGPQGTMHVDSAPPDDNGAVGPHNYVQIVNGSLAVFDKSGTVLYGPVPSNTLWSGFGGGCQANDDGDATVAYDRIADRWVISQFSVSTTPYLMCVAVSTTADPTGTYYRYSYQYTSFPDYPKLGVWPDAYYVTLNLFDGTSGAYQGPEVCAYDRAKMLAGQAATQQCRTLGASYGVMLPADLDGSTLPPSGSPNYLLEVGTGVLHLWKLHVDWTTPASSSLTGPTTLAVASFTPACSSGTACVPQSGTAQRLDGLGDRLMYRLAYRNFGDHASLVAAHAVVAGSGVGMRWYEIRNPGGTPTVYQQGTYAPDSAYRWMGSAAMDRSGDIALGYSISSSSLHPSIRYTARLASDPLGQMSQGEGTLFTGPGSQTGSGLERWGDYTSMSVDPTDDCTFWYTNEYLPANGAFNWRTRIGSFKLAGCGATAGNDFSISASPGTLTVAPGKSGASTVSTAVTSGAAQSVALSATGQPAGTSVGFAPASVTAGGSSTMTISVGSAVAAGTYTITVTGTGASATHTTTVKLTVPSPAGQLTNGGFETGSLSGWTTGGVYAPRISTTRHGGSYGAQIGSTGAVNGNSTLTQTVKVPAGSPTLRFWYQAHCADSITYDQIQMQVRSSGGQVLATVLNVCSNSSTWQQVAYAMSAYAGQTVVLWFNDHDDGYAGDPTYFVLDDVTLG